MFLKIRRNYGDRWSEVPEKTFECDRFDKDPYDPAHNDAEHAESMFPDVEGKVHPLYTLYLFKDGKFTEMLILGHVTIFVMSNEGKTIDTIYTY